MTSVLSSSGAAKPELEPVATEPRRRIASIDLVRGLIMVLMTIDHSRDYALGAGTGDPMNLETTGVAMFFTRWLSHFCAPGFILLAGVSVALQITRGLSLTSARKHLFTRGLVLIFLELVVLNTAWYWNPLYPIKFLQVIWAIGIAMLFLGCLVTLRPMWVGVIGLVITAGHNLFDGLHAEPGTFLYVVWGILHDRSVFDSGLGFEFRTSYPVLPAMGLIAAGYWLGTAYAHDDSSRRQRLFVKLGIACMALYAVLRVTNVHGDPHDFVTGPTTAQTVMSFFNPTKYPLSLQFNLMTVGPLLLLLAALDRANPSRKNVLLLLGQVPMFYYIANAYFLRGFPLALTIAMGTPFSSVSFFEYNYGLEWTWPLWTTPLLAGFTLLVLWPTLAPYARLRRTRGGWLRYL